MSQMFDIYDQAVLTTLINEQVDTALEQAPFLGEQIAPTVNIAARMARMDVARTYSFGIGQFKAPNAMPALIDMPVGERREALIELELRGLVEFDPTGMAAAVLEVARAALADSGPVQAVGITAAVVTVKDLSPTPLRAVSEILDYNPLRAY